MLIGNGYAYPPSVLQRGSKPLLDAFPGANIAFSLRKLRNKYTGAAIRVRRSSDNAEMNIGFSGPNLDTSTLLSFAGSGSCFVTTWYNQADGFSNSNLVQTAAASQPVIVSSGTIVSFANGRYGVGFNGTTQSLSCQNQPLVRSFFISARPSSTWQPIINGSANSSSPSFSAIDGATGTQARFFYNSANIATFNGSSNGGNDALYTAAYSASSLTPNVSIFRQTTSLVPASLRTIAIGNLNRVGRDNTSYYQGVISELICYAINSYNPMPSATISKIQSNIVGYYNFISGSMVIPLWIQYGSRVNANGAATAETAAEYQGCLNLRFDTLYNKI